MARSREDLAERFEGFADWCVGTSPLYEQFARGVAGDPELIELSATVPEGRSPPHLLLAGVHYLLLAGRDHPLAEYYPSVTDDPADPTTGEPFEAFRDFSLAYEAELQELLETRRTQTNSVRRSAALYPAFARVAEAVEGEPLSLIEVGSSAGLNLLWDRYTYEYDDESDGSGESVRAGSGDGNVLVDSAIREGEPPLPEDSPPVESRMGIDLQPLDVRDPGDARWLRALTWPEHESRRRLLADAIDAAREYPPDLRDGNALDLLPDLLEGTRDPVVVFNTQTLYQFPESDREQFRDLLAEYGTGRELHWLSGEHGVEGDDPEIWLRWATAADGRLLPERLLAYEQHGRWIRWVEKT